MIRWPSTALVFGLGSLCVGLLGCGSSPVSLPSPVAPLVATPDEAFRHEPPQTSPSRAFREPLVLRRRLENGLTLIVMPTPRAQAAVVRYVTRRGGEDGPPDLAGRAWFVGNLIERTVADRREDHLQPLDLFARVDVEYESASLTLRVAGDRVEEAIELAAQVVKSPNFEPSRIDDVRQKTLDRALWFGRSPERTSVIRARGMLYGYDHRAALPLWGSVATTRRVTRAELMALHHITWGPRDSALVVVGDVDPDRLSSLVEEALGSWETDRPPRPDELPWIALDSSDVARALGVESGAPRSLALIMEQAPPRQSRDYLPFKLLVTVLGGMRSARLNRELLDTFEGGAGVRVAYDARLSGGELVLSTVVGRQGREIASAINVMFEELDRMIDEGPTVAELDRARSLVRERTVSSLEHSDSAAAVISDSFALGFELSELVMIEDDLEHISPRDVRNVARRWLRPDRAPLVVTGDLNSISFAFNLADIAPSVVRR